MNSPPSNKIAWDDNTIVHIIFIHMLLPTEECGIVAQVCAPLAQAGISTYYICTFCNDHTLVSQVVC